MTTHEENQTLYERGLALGLEQSETKIQDLRIQLNESKIDNHKLQTLIAQAIELLTKGEPR